MSQSADILLEHLRMAVAEAARRQDKVESLRQQLAAIRAICDDTKNTADDVRVKIEWLFEEGSRP